MKTKLIALLLPLFCLSALADDAKTQLVVWAKDGTKAVFDLADEPRVTFTSSDLVITAKEVDYSYPRQEILRFTYEAVPKVEQTSSELTLMSQVVKPGATKTMTIGAVLDGLWAGCRLDITLPAGLTVAANAEGEPDLWLGSKHGSGHTVASNYIDGDRSRVHVEVGSKSHFMLQEGTEQLLQMRVAADELFSGEQTMRLSDISLFRQSGAMGTALPDVTAKVVETPKSHKLAFGVNDGWTWVSQNTENTRVVSDFLRPLAKMERLVSATAELVNDQQYGIVGNLTALSPDQGYRLKSGGAQAYTADEGAWCWPDDNPVKLAKGWNWIGYLPFKAMTVDDALAGLTPQENDRLQGADAFADYKDGHWQGSLLQMEPGTAYHYHAGAAATFSYPTSYPAEKAAPARAALPAPEAPWSYVSWCYPDVTSVIARLTVDGEPVSGWTLGAFCGDECRGIARPVGDVLFLTIHGTLGAAEQIRFIAYQPATGQLLTLENQLTFDGSAMGRIDAPVLLEAAAVPSGIAGAETGQPVVTYDSGKMVVSGHMKAGTTVTLYTLNGVPVQQTTVQRDGDYAFPLSGLNAGVYLLSVNGRTLKITKP